MAQAAPGTGNNVVRRSISSRGVNCSSVCLSGRSLRRATDEPVLPKLLEALQGGGAQQRIKRSNAARAALLGLDRQRLALWRDLHDEQSGSSGCACIPRLHWYSYRLRIQVTDREGLAGLAVLVNAE